MTNMESLPSQPSDNIYLVEWAVEVDDMGSKEIYDIEKEARADAKKNGLRLFRIEWKEIPL